MNMEQLGNISNILGLVTAGFSFFAWLYSLRVHKQISNQHAKQEEKIDIRLSDGQREIIVGHPRRKRLLRAEVNGLLGQLPIRKTSNSKKDEQPRYVFKSINWIKVNKKIEEAQDGDTSQFIILCSKQELDQFDEEIIKPVV